MTPEEFAAEMKEISEQYGGDEETAHAKMDDLMGTLLISLGYGEGVKVFDEQGKWYA